MFDNDFFENWLDEQAQAVQVKLANREVLSQNDMLVLVLKAQTNHIHHLGKNLHDEIVASRQDMDRRFDQVDKRIDQVDKRIDQVEKRIDQMEKRIEQIDKHLDQVDKRLDQMDKNFERVDKRFEQSDRRFEQMQQQSQQQFQMTIERTDSLMKWPIGTTLIVGGLVIAAMEFMG